MLLRPTILISLATLLPVIKAGTTPKAKNVIIQLFEWPWDSVASECRDVIGPAGYGYVQVSPAHEHVTGANWWSDYQPVSYKLISKRGNRDQFANMIKTCKAAGVDVLVDAVLNHMTLATEPGVGFAGSQYSKYDYPAVPYTASNFHYGAGNGQACQITGNGSASELTNCELGGLADLAQEQAVVRDTLGNHLKDLISLGAGGFRLDSARLIAQPDLKAILDELTTPFYNILEIIYGNGESDAASGNYSALGDINEFRAITAVQEHFLNLGITELVTPNPMGVNWGYLPSDQANIMTANHDTERNGNSLNVNSPDNAYVLSALFILAFNYGVPTIFSGYDFSEYSQPAPQDANGNTLPVTCFSNGWRCEHRWMAIQNMVGFHNAVGSTPLTNIFSGSAQRISFGRGNIGFIVINHENDVWENTYQTSLPDGNYCDIIHANFDNCAAATYTVSGGKFTARVGASGAYISQNALTGNDRQTLPSSIMFSTQSIGPSASQRTSSAQVWAHLLRKESSSSTLASASEPSTGVLPPLAPLDKNGTSMRILLHDTQAHFEKFSLKVDKLISGVDEAKNEMTAVNKQFQREHGILTEELVDLVNRSQTEVQKSVGAPAQAHAMESLLHSLEQRLEALNRRLDSLQTLNQTHSNTLHLQSQTLQSMQEQQRTITNTLIPLIPLVQAIPLHILSSRNAIQDGIRKFTGSNISADAWACNERMPPGTRPIAMHTSTGKRPADSAPVSAPPLKRTRTQLSVENVTINDCSSSTLMTSSPAICSPEASVSKKTIASSPPISEQLSSAKAKLRMRPLHEIFTPDRPINTPQRTAKDSGTSTASRSAKKAKGSQAVSLANRRMISTSPFSVEMRPKVPLTPTDAGSNHELSTVPRRLQNPLTTFSTPQNGSISASRTPLMDLLPKHLGAPSSNKPRLSPLISSTFRSSKKVSGTIGTAPKPIIGAMNKPIDTGSTSSRASTPITWTVPNSERKSPRRDGRRFIPLNDTDDEDE